MEVPKKRITISGLRNAFRLYSYIKPYRVIYILGLFFLFGSSVTNLAFPKLLGDLVNSGNEGNLGEDLNRIALILAGILVVQSVFSYFRVTLFVKVTERSLADLRQDTYNHLIRLPVSFFDKRRVGELNSRISSDISLLQETMTSTLAEFVRELIIIVGGIALLVYTSFKLTLFMLAVLPGVVLLAVFFGRFIRGFSRKAQQAIAVSNTIVEETLQGIQSVKAYTNESYEMKRYRQRTLEIAKIGIKGGRSGAVPYCCQVVRSILESFFPLCSIPVSLAAPLAGWPVYSQRSSASSGLPRICLNCSVRRWKRLPGRLPVIPGSGSQEASLLTISALSTLPARGRQCSMTFHWRSNPISWSPLSGLRGQENRPSPHFC
jgi:ABC-type multidrug transport system fused ATPase/permease subunit